MTVAIKKRVQRWLSIGELLYVLYLGNNQIILTYENKSNQNMAVILSAAFACRMR
jgi:hypothetical protein